MGLYLNPGYDGFEEIRRDIYVDKTGLIVFMNSLIGKPKPLVCFSRPRRFGKTFAADMLCAYYDKSCDSRFLFEDLEVGKSENFEAYINKYNVLSFDMTGFISDSRIHGTTVLEEMQNALLREVKEGFPGCVDKEEKNIGQALYDIVSKGNARFVFVIDEWDAIFREYKEDKQLQEEYILFLRGLFKNKDRTKKIIAAAYMTGILPVKKYGTESALSDFKEYTMTAPEMLEEYVGFTESEVRELCRKYDMGFDKMNLWYDGYSFNSFQHVYNPNSVIQALHNKNVRNYWSQTGSFESLKGYIGMNYDGLKDAIVTMLGGEPVRMKISSFQNDITSFKNADDVLTLLIHFGYLAYDQKKRTVSIPNLEVAEVFEDAVSGDYWGAVGNAIAESENLLDATLNRDEIAVADALEKIHGSVSSILQYNNEASLSCAITIAYYTAKRFYNIVRELPTGKGFADLAFIPLKGIHKPALIVELKYNKDADSAIKQIHDNCYDGVLKDYFGNLLLVGVNYNKTAKGQNAKRHSCVIEQV
ncbi:MAG: AAA family ATPase [Clostridiales bacterium]|nr:AAA family ATPase [Clostridiales bacterium]